MKTTLALFFVILITILGSTFFIYREINKKFDLFISESKEKVPKNNEISELFINFAKNFGLNSLARTYKYGCGNPKSYSSLKLREVKTDGFRMKCKVYDQDKLLVDENIDFNEEIDIDIFSGGMRGNVVAIKLDSIHPNSIDIPKSISKYAELVACEDSGSFTSGEKYYRMLLPSATPIFLTVSYSSGSGGQWGSVIMEKEMPKLKKSYQVNFLKPGERSKYPESFFVCD